MLGLCVLFVTAEITAEAMGLRDLNRQKLVEDLRLSSTSGSPVDVDSHLFPLPFFLIIGTLISGPYVAYKGARGWKEAESRQREAWIHHRRLEHVKALSREEPVQRAFGQARRVEALQKAVTEVDELLDLAPTPAMQRRLEYATSAAIGEAMRFHEMLDEMISVIDPPPGYQDEAREQ
ncbi:MAG: hypothetical protein C4321_10240 [Chloroflexota bacterium]